MHLGALNFRAPIETKIDFAIFLSPPVGEAAPGTQRARAARCRGARLWRTTPGGSKRLLGCKRRTKSSSTVADLTPIRKNRKLGGPLGANCWTRLPAHRYCRRCIKLFRRAWREFSGHRFEGFSGTSRRRPIGCRSQTRRRNSHDQRSRLDCSNEANADARPGPRYFQSVVGHPRCKRVADHGCWPDVARDYRKACVAARSRGRKSNARCRFRAASVFDFGVDAPFPRRPTSQVAP